EMRADARSGRVDLRTGDSSFDWPQMFRGPLAVKSATGVVVWRQNQNEVRVVSDNLALATPDASARTNLELTLPLDGTPPRLDLASKISSFAIAEAPKYLPAQKMPPTVVEWLDAALQGGIANSAEVSFVGPLSAFPFDHDEGQFRAVLNIEHARLAYVADWLWAEELDGKVEFVNASFASRGSGRVLGLRAPDVQVTIPALRSAVLLLKVASNGPLSEVFGYLDSSPLIAQSLGPAFARLEGPKGTADVNVDLKLPLLDRTKYDLKGALKISGGELAFRGFAPHATEINGTVTLARGGLAGDGIRAIFLDGPVTVRLDTPQTDGYRTRISLDGEVGIDKAATAFDLPFGHLLAGGTKWRGSLLIPALDSNAPPKMTVDSNLAGVAVRLPAPFEKPPAEPTNLNVQIEFPQDEGLDVHVSVGSSRRFAVQFDPASGGDSNFEFRRAALRFGGGAPEFRTESGITFDGSVGALDVDAWLALPTAPSQNDAASTDWAGAFAGAELESTDLTAFA